MITALEMVTSSGKAFNSYTVGQNGVVDIQGVTDLVHRIDYEDGQYIFIVNVPVIVYGKHDTSNDKF